jgi:hypothetical protein
VWSWRNGAAGEICAPVLEVVIPEHKFGSSSSGQQTAEGSGLEKEVQEKNVQVTATGRKFDSPPPRCEACYQGGSSCLYSSQAWDDMSGDEGMMMDEP